jgi:hypothetical protein
MRRRDAADDLADPRSNRQALLLVERAHRADQLAGRRD